MTVTELAGLVAVVALGLGPPSGGSAGRGRRCDSCVDRLTIVIKYRGRASSLATALRATLREVLESAAPDAEYVRLHLWDYGEMFPRSFCSGWLCS